MKQKDDKQIAKLELLLSNIRQKIHAIPTKQIAYKDITFAQMKVIRFLEYYGESTMKGIAEALGVTLPTITGIVDNLVKKGYLKRGFKSSDRRVVCVSLSAKAHKLLQVVSKILREQLVKIRDSLSVTKWKKFVQALKTIDDVLSEKKEL